MINNKIVSAITTSGTITIGNYLGMIKRLLACQKDFQLFIFAADLHSLSTIKNQKEKINLQQRILDTIILYYACGLNKNNIIFIQSEIWAHPYLAYLLMTHINLGELQRMIQFKEKSLLFKSKNKTNFIPSGLLFYPCLMAADILLYDPKYVVVGKDQKQHLELTQNIASRINKKYHDVFTIPKIYDFDFKNKIYNLQDPNLKMSKSSADKNSYISLFDSKEEVKTKILKAVTDSENKVYFDLKTKKGISNLLIIYAGLKDITINEAELEFKNSNYYQFKLAIIAEINQTLSLIQTRYQEIKKNWDLKSLLAINKKKAQKIADAKIEFFLKKLDLK